MLIGGSGEAGRPPWCCGFGAPSDPCWAKVYEGGRPSGFWGFMGSEELLEFEACGLRLVGRCEPVGVVLPCGDELPAELFLFEPTRFLKRAFMEFIGRRGGGQRVRVGWMSR